MCVNAITDSLASLVGRCILLVQANAVGVGSAITTPMFANALKASTDGTALMRLSLAMVVRMGFAQTTDAPSVTLLSSDFIFYIRV